tara:strand:- start:496 stop:933 length:438 start_codon:yes stop_codon:yes gene_type:complete
MTETQIKRIVPKVDTYVTTKPFWDAAAQRVLKMQRCLDTNRFQHPPRPVSVFTGSQNLGWAEVSGFGTIYALTVLNMSTPELAGRTPLPAATIELDEGVRLIANLVQTEPEKMRIGARVSVCWEELSEGVLYPVFKVVEEGPNET